MELYIDQGLLKPITPQHCLGWRLWEKKNSNIHRGVIEFTPVRINSIDIFAAEVREAVHKEFRPGWWRGFGFGTIIHLKEMPINLAKISQYVDTRNKSRGVWQWIIICLDEDKVAVAIHTWLHGYLRPVYDSVLEQLNKDGYQCYSTDTEMDALLAKLDQVDKFLRPSRWIK